LPAIASLVLGGLILALGGVAAWDRALLRGRRSPRAVLLPASGAALLELADGETVAVRALRGAGVTRHWVALAPLGFARGSLLVAGGMLAPPQARLLRLWALWGRIPDPAAQQVPA